MLEREREREVPGKGNSMCKCKEVAKGHCEFRTWGEKFQHACTLRCMHRSITDETREESWAQILKGHVCRYRQQGAVGVSFVGSSCFWKLSGG